MARAEQKTMVRKKAQSETMPFGKENYLILGLGLILIILGYVALAQEPWDGTMPLIVAPTLLLIGYCVVIPIGILYRKRGELKA
jgi:hypothetical protein